MRDFFEFAVPAVFTLLFFGLIFGFLGWLRWMRFRETLALADRGYAPSAAPNGTNRTLRWGLVLAALGLALSCGMAPLAIDRVQMFPVLIPGFLLLFLGLALLLFWLVTGGRQFLHDRGSLVPLPPPAWPRRDDGVPEGTTDGDAVGPSGRDDDADGTGDGAPASP